jgi:predicted MFS family arabinose efflux permease
VTRRLREVSLLGASAAGATPLDGRPVAACGTLVADGPLLTAPFSGLPCAIYQYEIVAPQQKSSFTVCSGYALTPCHVETGAGSVRVLAYVDLAFRRQSLEGAEMRGRALGSIGTVVAVGLTLGPPIGGLILSHLSWRWVFYVNLPVGIAGTAWALRVLPRGGAAGGPLLDTGIFRIPAFSLGVAAGFLSYAAMFSQTFLTPFLLARVLGLEPGRLGLVLSAVPLALAASSPLAGWISDRFGARRLPAFGMAVLAGALSTLSLAGASSTVPSVMAHLFVAGIGMGLFQAPNNATVMGALPRARLGSGGGLLATARNAGMAVGVGLAGTLFAIRAGPDAHGPEFLAGYALALRAGAVLALAAAAVSMLKVAAPSRPR